jgi:hypothetical protein
MREHIKLEKEKCIMSKIRISPLAEGKPIHKRKYLSWLLALIVVETIASGVLIFRQYQRIEQLETQLIQQTNGGQTNV